MKNESINHLGDKTAVHANADLRRASFVLCGDALRVGLVANRLDRVDPAPDGVVQQGALGEVELPLRHLGTAKRFKISIGNILFVKYCS